MVAKPKYHYSRVFLIKFDREALATRSSSFWYTSWTKIGYFGAWKVISANKRSFEEKKLRRFYYMLILIVLFSGKFLNNRFLGCICIFETVRFNYLYWDDDDDDSEFRRSVNCNSKSCIIRPKFSLPPDMI